MGFSKICCPSRTLSFDPVVYRAGSESMPIGYNCKFGLGLGLAAVLKSGSGFVVQWHCPVWRGGGCTSRPAMMLLRSCALRIGTEIRRKPEIHIAHINGSHGEKLSFLIDSPRKIEMMISWALLERCGKYIPVLSPPGVLICRTRLPWYCAGLHP
jgi:hypothetical protein